MSFFTDPHPFTHYGDFYGFPVYFSPDGPDGMVIAGTNVVWDWCILHFVPHLYTLITFIQSIIDPFYESEGWEIRVRGELPRAKK